MLLWFYFGLGTLKSYKKNLNVEKTFGVVFCTVQALTVLVVVVYWVLLSDEALNHVDPFFPRFRSAFQHTFNLAFTLTDLVFSDTAVELKDAIYPVLFLFSYQVVGFVWFMIDGTWPYR